MTTLQARSWAHVTQRVTRPRDPSRFWAIARTALGIALVAALLAAAFAMRVLVYVHL
jgi:ABC-type Fe3+ transport system permease subunit